MTARRARGERSTFKICLLGNSAVGKSCVAERLIDDTFSGQTESTIGSAYFHKELDVNGETADLSIWDTAGKERFQALAPLYYRDASAIVLVYDITDERSFESLKTVWIPAVQAYARSDPALAVVGNKLDLAATDRVITAEEARGYAEKIDAVFLETSAKTGENVERIFTQLVVKIREGKQPAAGVDTPIKLRDRAGSSPNDSPGANPKKRKSSRRWCSIL